MAVLDSVAVFCRPQEAEVRAKPVLEVAYCRLPVAQVREGVAEVWVAFCPLQADQVSLHYYNCQSSRSGIVHIVIPLQSMVEMTDDY